MCNAKMYSWSKLSIMLCFFGFLKQMRPSDDFGFEYVTGRCWFNFTSEKIQQGIIPLIMYSQIAFLVVMFLITDVLRYKPLIVFSTVAGMVCWSTLTWGSTYLHLQVVSVFTGIFFATEVAYYTYIYAKVSKEYYAQVTSHTRAALAAGQIASGILSQILVEYQLLDYQQLNYITLGAMVCAFLWALMLPSVSTSIYFHSSNNTGNSHTEKYLKAFNLIKRHLIDSYSQPSVIKWSIWCALSSGSCFHVFMYIQALWSTITHETDARFRNGAAVTLASIASFLGALSVGFLKVNWKYTELLLFACSVLNGICLIISSRAHNILISYAGFIVYGGVFSFGITIASSQVAKRILEDSYGLVFSLNTLVGLLVETLLVLVFVSGDIGWKLDIRQQYLVYGFYYIIIGLLLVASTVVRFIKRWVHTLPIAGVP